MAKNDNSQGFFYLNNLKQSNGSYFSPGVVVLWENMSQDIVVTLSLYLSALLTFLASFWWLFRGEKLHKKQRKTYFDQYKWI